MSPETNAVDPRLGELRRAFDRPFAAPPAPTEWGPIGFA